MFEAAGGRGATLVIVTHDRSLADRCDRRIAMRSGEIVEDARLTAPSPLLSREAPPMSAFVAPRRAPDLSAAFRFALRETEGRPFGLPHLHRLYRARRGRHRKRRVHDAGHHRRHRPRGRHVLGRHRLHALPADADAEEEAAFLTSKGTVSTIAACAPWRARRRATRRPSSRSRRSIRPIPSPERCGSNRRPPWSRRSVRRPEVFRCRRGPPARRQLGAKVGDTILIGKGRFTIAATITSEPDKIGSGIDFGPRVMMTRAGLDAHRPRPAGSLVRWQTRVKLPARSPTPVSPRCAPRPRRISRRGLADRHARRCLAGAEAQRGALRRVSHPGRPHRLVVGGVGVTNAVKAYVDRRRDSIATFKALGAPAASWSASISCRSWRSPRSAC